MPAYISVLLYVSHLYTELHASEDTMLINKASYYIYQPSFKCLGSRDPSTSAFQVAGTAGVCHHTCSEGVTLKVKDKEEGISKTPC